MRRLALALIGFYQSYISRLLPPSCRYYPSCSEYAKWQFANSGFFEAFMRTASRILRCNKLFEGGIDLPTVSFQKPSKLAKNCEPQSVLYWFAPLKNGKFKVTKKL